ncbi:MAG: hypothetical protein PUK76_06555, partial [Treponema sp.]|nr:hypothetical protein [Treponema sp.]
MKRTENLNLPIYDNPESDIFKINDVNNAHETIDKQYKELKNIKETVESTNPSANLQGQINDINASLDNISIQLDEFIVNGESDYTNAFIRANAMLSNGGTILLSCKEYNYSDIITLSNNVSLMCLNGYATLKALNLQKSCIKFGNNSRLENLILISETTSRDSLDT